MYVNIDKDESADFLSLGCALAIQRASKARPLAAKSHGAHFENGENAVFGPFSDMIAGESKSCLVNRIFQKCAGESGLPMD